MGTRLAALLVGALVLVGGCGDDGGSDGSGDGSGGGADEASGLEADAEALVSCLGEADVDAEVEDATAFGVEVDHVGVKVDDLPPELLRYDSGSGTTSGVAIWLFDDQSAAEDSRTAITLKTADDERSWVDGRTVVAWEYPVDREQPQAVAVDACVAELNG